MLLVLILTLLARPVFLMLQGPLVPVQVLMFGILPHRPVPAVLVTAVHALQINSTGALLVSQIIIVFKVFVLMLAH